MVTSLIQKKEPGHEERYFTPMLFSRDFQRQLEDFWKGLGNFEVPALASEWIPAADIVESDNDYLITLEAPGMPKENVKISFTDGILSVSGEKKMEEQKNSKRFYRMERSYGCFERSFRLPLAVEPEKIKAEFKDGLLKVTVPKSEKVKPKQIDIQVG